MSKYKININDIPRHSSYEGYVWWSDQKEPIVYRADNQINLPSKDSCNPFVAEANLFDKSEKVSYTIKFLDGVHHAYRFDMKELKELGWPYEEKKFLADMKEAEHLCFREYWEEKEDIFCDDQKVLQPAMIVFTGFQPLNKED